MFNKPTILIIGAGASFELGMPLGSDLIGLVAERLRFRFEGGYRQVSGDSTLVELLKQRYGQAVGEYTSAANELVSVLSNFVSLDEALHYLSAQEKSVSVGKLGIVYSILMAERGSILRYVPELGRPNVAAAGATWLRQFLSMALAAAKRQDIRTVFENVTFINFNYDRTLEQYLFWALQETAGIRVEEAKQVVGSLKVIRPYGRVGPLDWQDAPETGVKFGGPDYFGPTLFGLAEQIRTFTEQYESNIPTQIDVALATANVIIVLGFGYHDQNTKLLRPLGQHTNGLERVVFATMKGLDPENKPLLFEKLQDAFRTDRINLLTKSANEMLIDMRPSILAAAT
jgi:hypothetical protein